MNQPTYLYRHFDAEGELLYVGISLSATYRLKQHQDSEWAANICRVDVERHCNRFDALLAEFVAIRDETPKHNKRKTLDPAVSDYWRQREAERHCARITLSYDNVFGSGKTCSGCDVDCQGIRTCKVQRLTLGG